jgi:hypothetical protein
MTELVRHALLWGLLLSAWLTVTFVAIGLINAEMWLDDYPPDIRRKFGPMSRKANRLRWLLGLPVLLAGLALAAFATFRFVDQAPVPITFTSMFLHTLILLSVFNLIDLLLLDWLFFVRIQPRFVILPGTEGLAGYRDYAFHWYGFLKGTAGIVVFSIVAGVLAVLLA